MNVISILTMIVALSSSAVAFAGTHGTPNCDVGGKKIHVKNKAVCEKKKGSFLEEKAVSTVKDAAKPVEQKVEMEAKKDVVAPNEAPAPEVKQ